VSGRVSVDSAAKSFDSGVLILWLRQLDGISRSARLPDTHVIVTIDDPAVSGVVAASGNAAHVVHCEGPPGPLPVASARNIGALAALNEGAELLVFLDVDCIPGRSLLGRCYEAGVDLEYRDALLCRPVTYLAPPGVEGYPVALERMINPHPARPAPPMATSSPAPTTSCSGRYDRYYGYGHRRRADRRAAGVPMRWVGAHMLFISSIPCRIPRLNICTT
jgi:hypothetical protein